MPVEQPHTETLAFFKAFAHAAEIKPDEFAPEYTLTPTADESYNLLLLEMTKPSRYALRSLYQYLMTEEEKAKYWGKLEAKFIEIGINEIFNGEKTPVLRGQIVALPEK